MGKIKKAVTQIYYDQNMEPIIIYNNVKAPATIGSGLNHKEIDSEEIETKEPIFQKNSLQEILARKFIMDKVQCDIIIPTYENEQLTVDCFESIKNNTKAGTYRIIWIDNGSNNTLKAEKMLEGVNHTVIYLPRNIGFVGAVNLGLAESNAPTICILNNDTVVSDRWLEKLINVLYGKKEFGIVGPLTGPPAKDQLYDSHHNIAYQQRFRAVPRFPPFTNLANFNIEIEKQLAGLTVKAEFVAFLCAVIKREVIDKVGFLDPNYEMGMWDDADYNMAARKAGYETVLTFDTCINHYGRSTFKMIQEKEGFDVPALLKKNRTYLDKKWGLK